MAPGFATWSATPGTRTTRAPPVGLADGPGSRLRRAAEMKTVTWSATVSLPGRADHHERRGVHRRARKGIALARSERARSMAGLGVQEATATKDPARLEGSPGCRRRQGNDV